MDNTFSFFAPVVLQKSGDDPTKPIKVGGCITSETKDADGETLLTKGLDLSYFDGGWGKIKYEHDSALLQEPDNIIGVPTKIIRKGNKIDFEGELFPFQGIPESQLNPQQKLAKSAYGLLENIQAFNKANPSKPQKIGWSIEGAYLERNKKTGLVSKAQITNVVLTTKPKNRDSFATILKSLTTGYGTTPETQTGFGATRQESLGNINNKQRGNTMFKTKEECYKAMLSQGKNEDEARAMADQWEKKQQGNVVPEEVEKSISKQHELIKSTQEELTKSINVIEETKGETAEKFAKSLGSDSEDADLTQFFVGIKEQNDSNSEAIKSLAKSLGNMLSVMGANADVSSELAKSLNRIDKGTNLIASGTARLMNAKSSNSNLFVDNLPFAENNDMTETQNLTKSQKVDVLDKLYEAGKVSKEDVLRAETGFIDQRLESMIKSNANLLQK